MSNEEIRRTAIHTAIVCLANIAAWVGVVLNIHTEQTELFTLTCVIVDLFYLRYLLKRAIG